VDPEKLRGRPCFAGLDLASVSDLTAFVLLFPEDGNAVLPFFWVPRATALKRQDKAIQPCYVAWAEQGCMELTPGNVCDYDCVRTKIRELGEMFNIRQIAFDRWGATQLSTQLEGDGFEMVAFGQGYASLSAPSKELEKLVLGSDLKHGGHPVLRWNAGNVMLETDAAGNIKPSKKKSSDKIDGIVALVMALGRAIVREEPPRSIYSTRGVLQL
jgi:phage terminase large subunit-like protein